MRFAWLRKQAANSEDVKPGGTQPLGLIRFAYNLVFWVFLLPFVTTIDYSVGFLAFTVVIFVRLAANLYANNVIKSQPAQFERFPFRS
jgi:hypothetical protein